MPGLAHYEAQLKSNAQPSPRTLGPRPNPEDQQVWLPSALPTAERLKVAGDRVSDIEERLRVAQLSDALDSIRHILRIKTRMIYFKNKNIQGQRDGTRSRSIIDRVHDKAKAATDKYRAARNAKLALTGPGEWEDVYRILEDKDIRGYQDPNQLRTKHGRPGTFEDDIVSREARKASENPSIPSTEGELPLEVLELEERRKRDGTGETRRTLSWIWVTKKPGPEDDGDDLLRVEWAKSRARALRANEEVMLVREEMRHVLVFLNWKMQWWHGREAMRSGIDKALTEGIIAYARSQALLQQTLADSFRMLWQAPLCSEDLDSEQMTTETETIPLDDEEEDDDVDDIHDEDFIEDEEED